jgi:hypothetical protein
MSTVSNTIEKMKVSKEAAVKDRLQEGARWGRWFVENSSYSEVATCAKEAETALNPDPMVDYGNPITQLPQDVREELERQDRDEPGTKPASLAEQDALCEGFFTAVVEVWAEIEREIG